ncbi:hypothetical protein ETC05_01030 [Geobacillus sp. BMUD]|nr:hypothetical protein [Geobacillus sp. BMUD]
MAFAHKAFLFEEGMPSYAQPAGGRLPTTAEKLRSRAFPTGFYWLIYTFGLQKINAIRPGGSFFRREAGN